MTVADLDALRIHVGTYADRGGAGLYRLCHQNGRWSLGDAYTAAQNASFGVYSRRHGLHFLVDEQPEGGLGVFGRSAAGWQSLARVPTNGALPCHAALDPEEDWLAVANYGSGSTALFKVAPDGDLIGDPADLRENGGKGPIEERQDEPHAHCVVFSPDGRWLYQTDLGTDQVLAFPCQRGRVCLEDSRVAFVAPAGSGPRHLVLHPHRRLAVLVSELASTIAVLDVDDGLLSARETISTLPSDASKDSLGGHLGANSSGDRVYVTNRGHDSIATFEWDAKGRLTPIGHTPSGGASPRSFLLLEDHRLMLVANEEGNSVTIFEIGSDGSPSQCGELAVPAPAFIFATSD